MILNKIILVLTVLFVHCTPLTSMNNTQHPENILLNKYFDTSNGYGKRVLYTKDKAWISANPGILYVWNDTTLLKTVTPVGYSGSPLFWDNKKNRVLAGEYQYDLTNDSLIHLSNVYNQLSDNGYSKKFGIVSAVWDTETYELVVYAKYFPSRGINESETYEGPEGRVLLFDGNTGILKTVILETEKPMGSINLAISNGFIAIADGSIKVWDRQKKQVVKEFESITTAVREIKFNKSGNSLAVVKANGRAEIYDLKTGNIKSWKAHDEVATCLDLHPTLPIILTGSEDAKVKVWSTTETTPKLLNTYIYEDPIEGISLDDAGSKVAISTKFKSERIQWYHLKQSDK